MTQKLQPALRSGLPLIMAMACVFPSAAHTEERPGQPRLPATKSANLSVQGGSAPIEKALGQIIPAAYGTLLDRNVPSTLVLVWKDGDNWREVLYAALAPIGLAATPDWAANSISIGWQKPVEAGTNATGTTRKTGPEGSRNAPPVTGKTISVQAEEGERRQMLGTFEVDSVQESSGTITRAVAPADLAEEEKDQLIVGGDEIVREIRIIKTDRHCLPSKEELWELMKAAVGGATITLTGYSGSLSEPMRVKWANTFAYRLKARLENIGFPADLIKVKERSEYKPIGDKPHVEIKVSRKAV